MSIGPLILMVVVLAIAGMCVLPAVLWELGTEGTQTTLTPEQTASDVARFLIDIKLCDVSDIGLETQRKQIARSIRPINGYSESSGLHGDGCDYYVADLGPQLSNDIRLKLERFAEHELTTASQLGAAINRPAWWPKQWPEGTRVYRYDTWWYLFLEPDSTQAWLVRIRS